MPQLLDSSSALIDYLVAERKGQGLSQRQLAELAGIKQPMIARIESKRTCPSIDTLGTIARALGCTICLSKKDAG